MNNAIVIGDLHGRKVWKNFGDISWLLRAEKEAAGIGPFEPEYEFYIFLGDYTDSFYFENITIEENLLEIINFKKLYANNAILLWGNHDVHYALDNPYSSGRQKYGCTGDRPEAHYTLYEIFNRNYDLFQLAFEHKNYLFTHAGVHVGWWRFRFMPQFKKLMKELEKFDVKYEPKNTADYLNIAFRHRLESIFDIDLYRGGDKKVGGPLWLDSHLANKPLPPYHHVVGHNPVDEIYTLTQKTSSITFVDVLNRKSECYTINF